MQYAGSLTFAALPAANCCARASLDAPNNTAHNTAARTNMQPKPPANPRPDRALHLDKHSLIVAKSFKFEILHLPDQVSAAYTKDARGCGLIPPGLTQGIED